MPHLSVTDSFTLYLWKHFGGVEISYPKRIAGVIITPIATAVAPVMSVIDGLYGIIRGIGVALTNDTASHDNVVELFKDSSDAQSIPFVVFFSMLNLNKDLSNSINKDLSNSQETSIHCRLTNPLEDVTKQQLGSDSLFKRHVVSRSLIFIRGIVAIVARVVAFPIGLVAAVFATLAFGRSDTLSKYAVGNINITGILADIGEMVMYLINPSLLKDC